MKVNQDKSPILKTNKRIRISLRIDNEQIDKSEYEKIFGITVHCNLNFQEYFNSVLKTNKMKFSALSIIIHYMKISKGNKFM